MKPSLDNALAPMPRIRGRRQSWPWIWLSLLLHGVVQAQSVTPNSQPLQVPNFVVPAPAASSVLPPIELPRRDDFEGLVGGVRVHVSDFRLTGNTVLEPALLDGIFAAYRNRPLGFADLQALRSKLTRAYIDHGYITSGVLLPEQVIRDGVVELQAVEGRLTDVSVLTDGVFEPAYFADRLRLSAEPVIRIDRIEERLQRLQRDPRVAGLRAALRPGERRGEALLDVLVKERDPREFSVALSNHTNPSLGATGVEAYYRDLNASGHGDTLDTDLRLTEGLREFGLRYNRPINAMDTLLGLHLRGSRGAIVDDDFADLDIRSDILSYGLVFTQPLLDRVDQRLALYLSLDRRRSRSTLLDEGFSFSEGPENGVARLTLLRLGLDWQLPGRDRVSAARLQLTRGLDAWGATVHGDGRPDGRFTSLLGQVQHVQRFDWRSLRLILRGEFQLSDDRLLGLEQYALGGHASVRGYRENQVLRDQGVFASLEGRFAVWHTPGDPSHADLSLFVDAGRAANRHGGQAQTLSSIGVGLLGRLQGNWQYRVFWAQGLQSVDRGQEPDLQDEGLHFWLGYRWPG
jgi:hemolysin activation/secretion protein